MVLAYVICSRRRFSQADRTDRTLSVTLSKHATKTLCARQQQYVTTSIKAVRRRLSVLYKELTFHPAYACDNLLRPPRNKRLKKGARLQRLLGFHKAGVFPPGRGGDRERRRRATVSQQVRNKTQTEKHDKQDSSACGSGTNHSRRQVGSNVIERGRGRRAVSSLGVVTCAVSLFASSSQIFCEHKTEPNGV